MKKEINTTSAPSAVGAYSQAVNTNSFIFTSGQIPLSKNGEDYTRKSITVQTELVLKNIKSILESANSSMDKVVKATIFMTDINNFTEIDEIYKKYFTPPYPARSAIQVNALPKKAKVEIEVIAEK